jgi:hypothetical protein
MKNSFQYCVGEIDICNRWDAIYMKPVWLKYECDQGKRWTAVKGGFCEEEDGEICVHTGCDQNHRIHIKGETSDRNEAYEWATGWKTVSDDC